MGGQASSETLDHHTHAITWRNAKFSAAPISSGQLSLSGWAEEEPPQRTREERRISGRGSRSPPRDLAAAVPRSLEFFYDDLHFNDRGTALVAGTVAKAALPTFRAARSRGSAN